MFKHLLKFTLIAGGVAVAVVAVRETKKAASEKVLEEKNRKMLGDHILDAIQEMTELEQVIELDGVETILQDAIIEFVQEKCIETGELYKMIPVELLIGTDSNAWDIAMYFVAMYIIHALTPEELSKELDKVQKLVYPLLSDFYADMMSPNGISLTDEEQSIGIRKSLNHIRSMDAETWFYINYENTNQGPRESTSEEMFKKILSVLVENELNSVEIEEESTPDNIIDLETRKSIDIRMRIISEMITGAEDAFLIKSYLELAFSENLPGFELSKTNQQLIDLARAYLSGEALEDIHEESEEITGINPNSIGIEAITPEEFQEITGINPDILTPENIDSATSYPTASIKLSDDVTFVPFDDPEAVIEEDTDINK